MSGEGYTVDALGRRKWDKELHRRKAEEAEEAARLLAAQPTVRPTAPLQRAVISLEEIELKQRLSPDGLLHCEVCKVSMRDSRAFLDHINGKAHNRALGMTMNVQKATPDEVKAKLLEIRKRLYPGERLVEQLLNR